MKSMPYKGWCIFARNARTEWPLHFTFRRRRDDAIKAWKDEIRGFHHLDADTLFKERLAAGDIRVGRAVVGAAP